MALEQLSEEQIRTMTVAEKDRWWLDKVYKGDVPQFTLRAVLCGFLLGGFLSITNLYVGAKTGWTLGVGITSVILAFVVFRLLVKVGLVETYDVLENNIMQSIACSAGYMTAPLISSLAAYMLVTNTVIIWWQAGLWLFALAVLGVLFAFPLKRRFINDEQHPFPEGRAAGVVMDTLHGDGAEEGVLTARLLLIAGAIAAVMKLMQSHKIMSALKVGFLSLPEYLDGWMYWIAAKLGWTPSISGVPLGELTIRPELDIAMIGAGGLMGINTGLSLMVGAIVNYVILAPIMIKTGDIDPRMVDGVMHYGFRAITTWALWGGVAMMTTASMFSFFSKPAMLISAFKGIFGKKRDAGEEDCLKDIELPMSVFAVGIPVVGLAVVAMANIFFDVSILMGILAVPMVFIFTLIGVNSTALTSITPTGALGKLTQLTYGILAPGNIKTNLMTAGITGEVASNASNLLMNIKPGYMLGGKPRLQALGHVIGAISGAIASVIVFYPLFLRGDPNNLITQDHPMPAALIWKAVAEILTAGLDTLPTSAAWAALIGALLGILFEVIKMVTKGKFKLSAIGIGLAFVIPFTTCLAMAFGAFVFWMLERRYPDEEHRMNKLVVKNQEAICAGIIAGAALVGIATMAIELFVLS